MDRMDWYLTKIVAGAVLASCAMGGALFHLMNKKMLEIEESQKSAAKHFQKASAEDRLEYIRRGMVYFQCQDKATGLPYEIENIEKEDVTDEGLTAGGCTVTSSAVGGKSFVVAPASAPAP